MTSTCVCSEASINAVFRAAGSIDLCERIGLRVEQLVDIGQTLARSPDMARFASGVKPRRHGAQPLAAVQVGIHAGCAIASNCRRRSSNWRAAARSSRYRLGELIAHLRVTPFARRLLRCCRGSATTHRQGRRALGVLHLREVHERRTPAQDCEQRQATSRLCGTSVWEHSHQASLSALGGRGAARNRSRVRATRKRS